MATEPHFERLTQCPRCGRSNSGAYCSTCGAELEGGWTHPTIDAARAAFQLDEAASFLSTYRRILKAPVAATLQLAQDPTYHGHFRFAFTSVGWSTLITLIPGFATPGIPLVAEFIGTASFLFSLLLTAFTSYIFFSRFSHVTRTFAQHSKVAALAGGATMMPVGLVFALGDIWPTTAALAALILIVVFVVFQVRLYRRFWHISAQMVLAGLAIGGLPAFALGASAALVMPAAFGVSDGSINVESGTLTGAGLADLKHEIDEINASLPTRIDRETELRNITLVGHTISFNLHMVTLTFSDIDESRAQSLIAEQRSALCSHPVYRSFLETGATFQFNYFDVASAFVMSSTVEGSDCR